MKRARVIVFENGVLMGEYDLAGEEMLIGRGPSVHVQVAHDGVSREHAVISESEGEYFIEDLHSTNGLSVNGKRVGSASLRDGDLIQIGNARLVFRIS